MKLPTIGVSGDRLPEFFAVGPPRTATTWLYRVLRGHAGLAAGIKETQFFSWNYDLGIDWYKQFFRRCPPNLPIGEISPTYFDYGSARERIKQSVPGAKIIITLRDPVDRMYSQYKLWRCLGLIDGPFDYATQREVLSASASYAFNIQAWVTLFGRDRVLVLFHEDLERDPQRVVGSVCAFIEIPTVDVTHSGLSGQRVLNLTRSPLSVTLAKRALKLKAYLIRQQKWLRIASLLEDNNPVFSFCFGRGPNFSALDESTKSNLRAILRPEIEDLERLVCRNLSHWK